MSQALRQSALRRRIVYYILVRLGLASLFLGLLALLVYSEGWTDLEPRGFFYLVALTYLVMGVSAAGMAAAPNLKRFAYLQLFSDTAIITALVSQTNGIESIFGTLYFLSIVASAYLVTRPGAVIVAGVNSTAFLMAAILQHGAAEIFSAQIYPQVLVKILGFFMVAVLAGELSRQLKEKGRQLAVEEAHTRAVQHELVQVVQTIRSGLAIVGADGRLRSSNPMALQLFPELADSAAPEVIPDFERRKDRVWEVVRPGEDGERYLIVTWSDLEDGGGVLTMEDVTSLREMEELVRREERYTAVGNLAASIAHEIRNPLAALSGAIQLLKSVEGEEELHQIVRREVRRLSELVTRFLQSTRSQEFHPVPTDLENLVEEVIETFTMDPAVATLVQVGVDFQDMPPVVVDRERIRQVLWNVLLNAAQAMPEGGLIRVSGVAIGERVRLLITDQGVGIPSGNIERLFDPFFSTRVGGTGLGLATVERAVKQHGGEVWVQSEEGGGTTFAIWLPLSPPEMATGADRGQASG